MKKHSILIRLAALALAIACTIPTAHAEEATEQTQYVPVDGPSSTNNLAYGSVCILNGCRTIDSFVPLDGTDRRLDSAQAAFAFERNTGTLVYAYNPDAKIPLGGLAKLVLALVTLEYCDISEVLTVANNSRFPTGQVHVNLKNEEQLTVAAPAGSHPARCCR